LGRNTLIAIVAIISIALCSSFLIPNSSFLIPLEVFGNIPPQTRISSIADLQALALQHNITRILIVATDSIAVQIWAEALPHIELHYNNKKWSAHSDILPNTVNLKDISYIAVDSDYTKYQLGVFEGVDTQEIITPYQHIVEQFREIGSSQKNNHYITKYTVEEGYDPTISDSRSLPFLIPKLFITTNGNEEYINGQTGQTRFTFTKTHWLAEADTLTIIWEYPPEKNLQSIKQQLSPLLLICLDGLGYNIWQNARANAQDCYLTRQDLSPYRTVYPPKTKHVLGTLFNGFHVDNAIFIEDDKVAYSVDVPITMNTDRNGDGYIDDEIFASAMQTIEHYRSRIRVDLPFMFVHFHSIDDAAHANGPYTTEVMQRIAVVSGYVEQLVQRWGGEYILFSDHGLHPDGFAGSHGINRMEDMVGVVLWSEEEK